MMFMLAAQVLNSKSIPPARQIVAVLASFVIAVTVHEFMHAFTAWKLGDPTAKDLGRITFNPMMHFDPFGFFGMVMISLGFNFIGWGKPVPVNLNQLHGDSVHQRKREFGAVALAGPMSNVALAAAATGVLRLVADSPGSDLYYYLYYFFVVNVLLASFNAIPIPPLDGYNIMLAILPGFWYPVLAPMLKYGFMILFALFFLGSQFSNSPTAPMTAPIRDLLFRMLP